MARRCGLTTWVLFSPPFIVPLLDQANTPGAEIGTDGAGHVICAGAILAAGGTVRDPALPWVSTVMGRESLCSCGLAGHGPLSTTGKVAIGRATGDVPE